MRDSCGSSTMWLLSMGLHCRFVDSVHREREQGVPLQHLGEIVNVEGFDIDSWVRPEVVKNEVCLGLI